MKFKSKIGWWFHLVVLICLAIPVWLLYIRDYSITAIIVFGAFILIDILLVLPIYFFTYYTLEDTALRIRCGLYNKRIVYSDITKIYETHDPSASVGLSLDRISVNYSKGEFLISPKDKQEFFKLLKQRIAI